MEAAAQQVNNGKSTATSAVLEKITAGVTLVKTALSERFQYSLAAFHDTLESRRYRSTEAARLGALPAEGKEESRIAGLLLCTTSARVLEVNEGLNHFKSTEQGIQRTNREEYLRQPDAKIWELKVEGDQLHAWTAAQPEATRAATNDIMTVLNGSFFVKVIPFELRGSER